MELASTDADARLVDDSQGTLRSLLGRCGRPGLADEEAEEDQEQPDDHDEAPMLGLASIEAHRDRGPGGLVVTDAAAPGVVARRVGALVLECLVAGPRDAGPRVAEGDKGHTAEPQDDVQDAHQSAAWSSR